MLIINNTIIRSIIENLSLLQQILIRKAVLPNSLNFLARQLSYSISLHQFFLKTATQINMVLGIMEQGFRHTHT
jgi:hypothetical protein